MPSHFRKELFTFLKSLKRHNDRDWFLRNKERYDTFGKDAGQRFVADLQPYLKKICLDLKVVPSGTGGSMMRIYRDLRFSEDKSPYKTHVGFHFPFRPRKGEWPHMPGFYLHLGPGECFAGAGLWHADPRTLRKVRDAIVEAPDAWRRITRKITLGGDSLKKAPRGYDPAHPLGDDLKRLDFISSVTFSESQVCSASFLPRFHAACVKMAPLVRFIVEAQGLEWRH